jgi:polyhydroxyalkanoate synthesis regulator phasin
MPGFGDLVQKAFYLGVGIASYAGEKASSTLAELRSQAQKLADEMVARGEITAEEAKRMVDEMVSRAQQPPTTPTSTSEKSEPRRIEILSDDEPAPEAKPETKTEAKSEPVDDLRQQVIKLQEELRRLRQD